MGILWGNAGTCPHTGGGWRQVLLGWSGTGDTVRAESRQSLTPSPPLPIHVPSPRMEELKQNKEVDSLQTRGLAS